jgi:peptide/nickel transport system ATP-binding protein
MNMSGPSPVAEVDDLHLEFHTYDGVSRVLNGVSIQVSAGDVLGLVGETGSGKTLTALSIVNLVPQPPALITRGEARFLGRNVLEMNSRELREIRGKMVALIFQDPSANLNPVFTVGEQLVDVILNLEPGGYPFLNPLARLSRSNRRRRSKARGAARDALEEAGVRDPMRVFEAYPHELSVGLRQRALIAMALAGNPRMLIADEPTTALDVRVEGQILALLRKLVRERGLSVLLITHDISVVARVCNRVAVMYAGNVAETGPAGEVLRQPRHPYTVGLLNSLPGQSPARGTLTGIPGSVPDLLEPPPGCRFHPRCWLRERLGRPERCVSERPPLREVSGGHTTACHFAEELTTTEGDVRSSERQQGGDEGPDKSSFE